MTTIDESARREAPAEGGHDGDAGRALDGVLGEIVSELLDVPGANPDDDFLDLGGASLTAVHLVIRIQEQFDVDLSLAFVFDHSTIAAIADEVERLRAQSVEPAGGEARREAQASNGSADQAPSADTGSSGAAAASEAVAT